MTLKIGIWGGGHMGLTHGRILRGDPRVRVDSVYDVDEARCRWAASELGCAAASSEDELLERADAVYITLPNTLHARASLRALDGGRHVFCEKPFATSLDDARAVRDRARESDRIFMVGHNRRFAPVYQALKEELESGDEPPTLAQVKMNRGELESPAWVGDASVTGGYLFETPLHLLDMTRWLLGEVVEMRATGGRRVYHEPDNFALLLETESGVAVTFVSCAHATWSFPYERVEVYGRYLTIETAEMERVSITRGLARPTELRDFHPLAPPRKMGYAGIDAAFVEAVLGEAPPPVTAEDGYRSVELVDRCYRAIGFFT